MEEKDLLEILATAAVTNIAHELRGAYMAANPSKAPQVSEFFEEAAQMMRRRRQAIIPMLK